jgi:antitoxin VapB
MTAEQLLSHLLPPLASRFCASADSPGARLDPTFLVDPTFVTPSGYSYTMALNIKDPETERLASEIAALTGESKTGAVRQALTERKQRILLARSLPGRGDRMVAVLERRLWPRLPDGVRGRTLSKDEEEAILGFGPEGL